jgi:hypothetical protein
VLLEASIRRAVFALVVCAGVLLPASSAAAFQRGFTITAWSADAYLAQRSDTALTRMADDGSDHAAVFTQWFMDSLTSSSLAPDPQRTPSDAAILHAMATAQAAGMAVTIKPQIGIRTGNWIGFAHPADLDTFWAGYRTMLLHYADLAEQGGAKMLVVGTEMCTLSGDSSRWRALIAEVREHFHGELTYAANFDEFQRVQFWDALDYVGVDAYFGLANEEDPAPPAETLAAAWSDRGYLAQLASVSRRTGKQILFTEIGYRGIHPTAVHPNQWNVDGDTDVDAQARAYTAFYDAVADQPWLAGVYWWGVESDGWWVKDYNPLGKPAEAVMASWNRRPPPPAPAPTETPAPASPETPTPAVPETPAPADTPAPALTSPPSPAATPPKPASPLATPAIAVSIRGRRLHGAVTHYSPRCRGSVTLRVRRRSQHRWRYVRPTHPRAVDARGRFSHRLLAGRLRVRAVFGSRCGHAASRWLVAVS